MPHSEFHIWLETVDSTMDYARKKVKEADYYLIAAEEQTAGKGSQRRTWESPGGNLHLTIGIHQKVIPGGRKSLLPLDVGCALLKTVEKFMPKEFQSPPYLKWPNDLLINEKKIAGTLIESFSTHLLVGIGINLEHAPEVRDGGRQSGCLREFGVHSSQSRPLSMELFNTLKKRLTTKYTRAEIVKEWSSYARWNRALELRNHKGKQIWPVKINDFGQLLVRHTDGSEEWLTSSYPI